MVKKKSEFKDRRHSKKHQSIRIRQAMLTLEKRHCILNPFYFATHYCYTLDSDDRNNSIKLFPSYDYLKSLFIELEKGIDIHIEKSRQMLLSWGVMIYFFHQVLFKKDRQLLVISSKQELVDDGGSGSTPQSLLGKIRFCFVNLPHFLKETPSGYDQLSFKQMHVVNRCTGSIVKGESSSLNAGRGGNYHLALLDEAAFIPNSEAVFTSARLACKKGLILCSTPNSKGNVHWRIRYGQPESGFTFLRFHWSQHPERSEDWYKKRCRSMTDLQIARELDISYEGSTAGRIYTEFDYTKHVSCYHLLYNPDLPLYTTWDFGIGDPTSILFLQTDSRQIVFIIDEYEDSGKDSAYYAGKSIEIIKSWGLSQQKAVNLLKESEHYGDPAGLNRGPRLESWIGDLNQRLGIKIITKRGVSKLDKINRVKLLFREGRIIISPHCTHFIEAIQNYVMETDEYGRILSDKPIHNWASHMNDAFQEFCINRFARNPQKLETFRLEI